MSKIKALQVRLRLRDEVLADELDEALAEALDKQADLMVQARNAGAREAFNAMRCMIEMKSQEVSVERVDPVWLARLATG